MKYAAIYRTFMLRAPAIGAEDGVIGAWTRLLVHASDVEAGVGVERATRYRRIGVAKIRGCKSWDEQQWLRSVGTTAVEAVVATGLAHWRGPDLIVEGYDCWGQRVSAIHLRSLQGDGNQGKGLGKPPAHTQEEPPYGGATSEAQLGAPSGRPSGQLPSPPSGSGSPPPAHLADTPPPPLRGGSGGVQGRRRAPPGAEDPETGPEGFEAWWALYPKTRARWRDDALARWVGQDLEGQADEILAFTQHQIATSRQWRRGEDYVDSPRDFLQTAGWRKRGPWNAPPAAPRARSSETQPKVVDAGLVDVTGAVGWLHQLLEDPDIDEGTKERHRRAWLAEHPGQQPPWTNGARS